eukprot:jgi/Hompol1/2190/HPOL_001823-RA
MFFSETILAKKGPLAKVWLAAHWERKLSKTQFLQTSIEHSITAILGDAGSSMALRLTGQLLLGVVKIFSRKARYLLEDCNEALMKIKMAFRPGMVDMTEEHAVAAATHITLPENMTEFDILLPEPRIDFMTLLSQIPGAPAQNISRLQDITLVETSFFAASQRDDLLADEEGDPSILLAGLEEPALDLQFGDEPSAMDVEVGRDAAPPAPFLPEQGRDANTTIDGEKSILAGADEDPSADISLNQADTSIAPLADEPLMQLVGDDNYDFGFDQPFEMYVSMDFYNRFD